MNQQTSAWRLDLIVNLLRSGAVIAYPTEGVWGLGCIPEDQESVSRILHLKRRSWQEGLILAASDVSQVEPYLEGLSSSQRETLEAAWPGPITWLVPDNGVAPAWITGRHNRVALRVSSHPVIKGICDRLQGAIVSTSANPTGKPAAKTNLRVRQYFPKGIDYIVPGELGASLGASEIRDLMTGDVIRPA
ncbi:MAG: Sua5/YciO/YrdC/YwlC family protein [Pseudomonadales bacterium]|nr:Sua5/YciO/YrdC/YwlC family protein [Pseudomonadales bacterium]